MTVSELIALLSKYPPSALIVFEDCTPDDDDYSYERFEVRAISTDEVALRLI